jgi:hypothetical protein
MLATRKSTMKISPYLTGAVLLLVSLASVAQAPFQVIGLSTDLVFADAVAVIEKLGAVCQVANDRTPSGINSVRGECAFSVAGEAKPPQETAAKATGPAVSVPTIGEQSVTHIVLSAPLATAQLERIMIVMAGSLDAVIKALVQQYGPPDHDSFASKEPSWSHSKRKAWIKGFYTLGLINAPQVVTLTANRPNAGPAPG